MIDPLPLYNSIGEDEFRAADLAIHGALSGFLGGALRGGYWVQRLEDKWQETFGVRHAIVCNSATSGLLAAAAAVELGPRDVFLTTPFTMSATSAAPMLLGAEPHYCDVEEETFGYKHSAVNRPVKAIVVTNLFGHPIHQLASLRKHCDQMGYWLIEDNAQAPFATENGRYTGTIGHIGVFSLNVHKHIQCGEGGVCVTDDDELAERMRFFINHGEMAGESHVGLNLRMTEITAAIALAQLRRANWIMKERIAQAEAILDAIPDIPGLRKPVVRTGCTHVYYTIPFLVKDWDQRDALLDALAAEGVPLVPGYVTPVYRLEAFEQFAQPCHLAEDLHDERLFYFENCKYDPTDQQIRQIGEAFAKAAEGLK